MRGAGGSAEAPLQIAGPGAGAAEAEWQRRSLHERARSYNCQKAIPAELIKLWVGYARAHCHPTLSHDAKLALKDFYLDLRRQAATNPNVPITVRVAPVGALSLLARDVRIGVTRTRCGGCRRGSSTACCV